MPTLFPCYLPYETQHCVVNRVQNLLEKMCFEFGTVWFPKVLARKQWGCPQAVELPKFTHVLAKQCKELPADALNTMDGSVEPSTLATTTKLRNAAVHRQRVTAAHIVQMVSSATKLAAALDRGQGRELMQRIHGELSTLVEEIESHKKLLENRLDAELKAINEQRAELDRKEKETINTMFKSDRDYTYDAAASFEQVFETLLNASQKNPLRSSESPLWSFASATPQTQAYQMVALLRLHAVSCGARCYSWLSSLRGLLKSVQTEGQANEGE